MADADVATVELLARRAELLRALADGAGTKRDLVAAQSASRSTVDRAVRQLETRGFVERGAAISLTLQGRLALEAYERLLETLGDVDAASGVLDALPADATVDEVLVRGADVVGPEPVTPQRPYLAYQRLVEDATAVRGFASAVLADNVPAFRDRIVEDGLPVDLTVAPDALDELVSSHADAVEAALATGRLTLRRATTTLEYSLVLVEQPERTVACALVGDGRGITGLVKNDSPDAVRWAEGVYDRIRRDAEPLHS
jgi:predicted transcriptional regulator